MPARPERAGRPMVQKKPKLASKTDCDWSQSRSEASLKRKLSAPGSRGARRRGVPRVAGVPKVQRVPEVCGPSAGQATVTGTPVERLSSAASATASVSAPSRAVQATASGRPERTASTNIRISPTKGSSRLFSET